MSNAVSENNTDGNNTNSNTETIEEQNLNPETSPEPIDPNMRTIKEEVIVPEVVDNTEEDKKEESFVPIVADNSDIAKTNKKKSTLSKVGKGLASIIASI